jgi:hypothetical protein
MAALFAAEVRRITSRRLVRLTAALALIGTLLGGAAAFAFSGPLSEQEYQHRVDAAEARLQAQDAQIEACLRANGIERGEQISNAVADKCFPDEDVGHVDDPRFHRSRFEGILRGVTGALAVIGWALGASLVGAEFASRSMTTLLTWEQRRGRVFLAKAVAAMLATAVLATAALALLALAMWPALAAHGAPLGPDDPTLWSLAGTIGRGIALATISAGIGFAIATIGRNTAAALGAGFAYVIVLENIVGTSIAGWRRWLLLGNVVVFVSGRSDGSDVPGRSVTGAGLFLAAVAVGALIVAGGTFRRRDLA